jgi:multiple sugar transport system ATP-binding protein
MATVVLKNVKKIYNGGVVAVHDFNLSIKDKEFIVFVGPSGCGKSTTLRMVAGLEDISEGTVEIDGEVVNDLQPKDRGVSMVFQNYALYPHLTVYENMAFPLRLLRNPKMSNDEIYERVTNAAKILGITQYLTRKPKNLSGGQRQRVAIGRAMVRDSKVFLMDEPLSNLDAKLRNQMRAEIILLRQRIQTTFIYVTHDQTEAMTLGDRIVIMKDGFIMQVGTPEEVFDRPGNLFVAEFIGAPKMNTFLAKLVRNGNQYCVECFGAKLPITGPKAKELADKGIESQTIVLGVRPEHMIFEEKPREDLIPCEIIVNEMMGSELHLHVLTPEVPEGAYGSLTPEEAKNKDFLEDKVLLSGGKKELIIRIPTINLTTEQRADLVPGKTIYLGAESKVLHFFTYEKGKLKTNLLYGPGEEAEASQKN